MKFLLKSICLLLFFSCAAKKPFYKEEILEIAKAPEDSNIDYEIFLVGDIGANSTRLDTSDIVDLIKSQLKKDSKNQSVIFLGNSISREGLPEDEAPEFSNFDRAIENCIVKLKDNTDKLYFIPGSNEWYDGEEYTTSSLQQVEDYLQSKVDDKNIFAPSNGCGEPKVVELTDDLLLLMIDSQWVLQGDSSVERKRSGCEIDNEAELISSIRHTLSKNKKKNVIIASNHPIYSNGKTGGNFGIKSHLLPLPILGSLFSSIKKLNGGQQRFGHPLYESYRAAIKLAVSNFEGVIHMSAQDHNLQYHNIRDNHFVVAGSGSDVEFVRKGGTADFAYMEKGFAKITHTKDLELWLEFYVQDIENPNKAKSVFKKLIYKKKEIDYTDKTVYKKLEDYPESIKVQASKVYGTYRFAMGSTYRSEWAQEIDVPLLLLDEVEGGLKPVQQGGGFQTTSLRLENAEGRQWVIRTIDKDITKIVPPEFRGTIVQDVMQDGLSAGHPYGAFVIPKLAEAANIYHANPKYVWVPKQKALGDYNIEIAEKLYLFEERPGGNMEGHPNYGGAKESKSTVDLAEKLMKSHEHKVDQKYVLRARLFDMLIGDWDRHGDQWRWGVYEDEKDPDVKIYRAIPRDRDQAFFRNDGLVNYIASRPYFTPALQKFDYEIGNLSGLVFNAKHFDRHFLSELNEDEFIKAAQTLQNNITDEVIQKAFKDWPEEIHQYHGDEIIKKLKKRREDLVKYAQDFYHHLTKEVTVVGTNSPNIFNVTTLKNNFLKVEAYHLEEDDKEEDDDDADDNDEDKDDVYKKHLIYSRVIKGEDCNELRLFGLKKDDTFNFYGNEESTITVRVVGGSGSDLVENTSHSIKVIAYDKPYGMTINGSQTISKLKDQKGINRYNKYDWKLNRSIHYPMVSFYTDEGIGLSYNVLWIRNGFRKNPNKSNHSLNVGYFFANSAIVGNYSGHWTDVLGPDWDFNINVAGKGPTFTQFYYGLGNKFIEFDKVFPDVQEAETARFHIVRGTHLDVNTHFEKNLRHNRMLTINPSLEYYNLNDKLNDPSESRFVFLEEANINEDDLESNLYAGLGISFESDRVNNSAIPTRGYLFTVDADYKQNLSKSKYSNLTVASNVSAYLPFSPTHKVVIATNLGGSYTFGDYQFFHANYLPNQSRLRGYRINRFAGDGIIYHATDLRIKVFQSDGFFKTGLGIFGSFDYGRAFLEEEDSNQWHNSYGGGIYIMPLNTIGFKIGYYIANEDTQISIGGVLSFE